MMPVGKLRGLARLADESGHFIMLAVDQRPPLIGAIAKARGIAPEAVTFADMVRAKRLLVQALAGEASAVLLDPNFGIPAALDVLPAKRGLIVTLEEHRFQETPGGRKSRSIDNWTVEKIRRLGGDAVKVLAWYRPDASAEVIAHQRAYVRTVGVECRRHDIPYVLELLVYPHPAGGAHPVEYREAPDKRAELVIESVREFARPEYGVDLFKLETPVPSAALPEPDGGPASAEAGRAFATIGEICCQAGIPWVLLSGGIALDHFARVLSYAYQAGAQGFLAGRTIWLDPILSSFPDEAAVLAKLESTSLQRLHALAKLTREKARPWRGSFDTACVSCEGDFAAAYA
jgi:tagatose 1,6-diphosphate aldolase